MASPRGAVLREQRCQRAASTSNHRSSSSRPESRRDVFAAVRDAALANGIIRKVGVGARRGAAGWSAGAFWGYSGQSGAQLFHIPATWWYFGYWFQEVGDFNADGFDDFAIVDDGFYAVPSYLSVYVFGGPSATPLWSHTTLIGNPGPIAFRSLSGFVGDLDRDGHADVALVGGAAGVSVTIMSGRDQSFLVETRSIGSPGDFDGDGFPDLLTTMPGALPNTLAFRLISGRAPGATPIGTACAGATGPAPFLGIGVGARLGRTLAVHLSDANPALTAAILGIGFSDQQWNATPLPIDLTAYGMPGCQWYIAADIGAFLATVGLNGTLHHATHEIPVPQLNQLLGVDLFCQWLVLESNASGPTGAVTLAMRTTVVQ